jgi:hypothetical protein
MWKGGAQAPQAGAQRQPLFRAPAAPPVRTMPTAGTQGRIEALQRRTTPKLEVESEAGVPALELNSQFPQAGSKDVVELAGKRYVRRFRPAKEGEVITRWETSWAHA